METKFPMPKSLEERQNDIHTKLEKKLKGSTMKDLSGNIGHDMLKFMALAGLMERDLWDEFWGVYRDTVEASVEGILDAIEKKGGQKRPNIFG